MFHLRLLADCVDRLDKIKIWEACRATSAAFTYLRPITIDGYLYRDGGLKFNNPVQYVYNEAREIWPDRDVRIISIGTGLCKTRTWDPKLITIIQDLADEATDLEKAAQEFYRRNNAAMAKAWLYFRFNVPKLGNVGLDEVDRMKELEKHTLQYLDDGETGEKVSEMLAALEGQLRSLPKTPLADIANAEGHKNVSATQLEDRFGALRS